VHSSIVLACHFGVAGVIWGTILGNAVAFPLYVRLIFSTLEVSYKEFIRKVVLRVYPVSIVCGIMLVIAVSLRNPRSLVGVLLYGVVYMTIYFLLFYAIGLDASERRAIVHVVRDWKHRLISKRDMGGKGESGENPYHRS